MQSAICICRAETKSRWTFSARIGNIILERICADWRSRVKPEDIVLIPGDISWAMQLGDALSDLRDIAKLPGTILLLQRQPRFLVVFA